jgi:hypothetical protein
VKGPVRTPSPVPQSDQSIEEPFFNIRIATFTPQECWAIWSIYEKGVIQGRVIDKVFWLNKQEVEAARSVWEPNVSDYLLMTFSS